MDKKAIRSYYKAERKKLSSKERDGLSKAIFNQTKSTFDLRGKNVSVFLPIERFTEINTWLFINDLSNTTFYLPVIQNEELEHIRYEGPEQIKITDWGIPEPQYGEKVNESVLDVVLVPLLAIDKNGYRVGYGKGFYDRFLNACRPDSLFIGLSYYPPIDAIDDLHENDIPLNYCVHPEGVIQF